MDTGCIAKKQAKHMDILDSIKQLERAKEQLQCLFDEIVGAVVEKPLPLQDPKDSPTPTPTLLFVLNQAGSKITDEATEIIKLTNEIKEQIF